MGSREQGNMSKNDGRREKVVCFQGTGTTTKY